MRKLSLDSVFPGFLIHSSNASACCSSSGNASGSGSNAFGEEVLKAGEPTTTCLDSTILVYRVFQEE